VKTKSGQAGSEFVETLAKTGFPTRTAGAIPTTNFLPLRLTPLPSQTLPTQHQQNTATGDGVNDLPVHIHESYPYRRRG
jgi:hypothetical protein